MNEWSYPFRTGAGPHDDAYWYLALRANGVYYYYRSAKDKFSYQTRDAETAKRLHFERFGEPRGFTVEKKRKLTVEQGFEEFKDRLGKRGRKDKTIDGYDGTFRHHISPIRVAGGGTFGQKPIHKVDAQDVLAVLDAVKVAKKMVLVKGGKGKRVLSDEPLGDSAKKHTDAVMSSLFSFFAEPSQSYIKIDPTKLIGVDDRPKKPDPAAGKDSVFSDEEIDAIAYFVGTVKTRRPRDIYTAYKRETLALVSPEIGWRIAEALACELADVDLDVHKCVHIRKQIKDGYTPANRSTWFDTLKGKNDRLGDRPRDVPLSDFARETLRAYIERGFSEQWLRHGGLLFPTARQTPIPHTSISEYLREASAVIGRPVRSHFFRHTYASKRIHQMPIQRLAHYLGHTPEMTHKVYGHWLEDRELMEQDRHLGRKAVGG